MSPTIDISRLQEIKKKLKELPKIERVKTFSGPEALVALKKDIRALSRKGYDSKEIAKILKQEGLSVSSAKVKKILVDELPGNGAQSEPMPGRNLDDHKPVANAPDLPPRVAVGCRPGEPKPNGKDAQQ